MIPVPRLSMIREAGDSHVLGVGRESVPNLRKVKPPGAPVRAMRTRRERFVQAPERDGIEPRGKPPGRVAVNQPMMEPLLELEALNQPAREAFAAGLGKSQHPSGR